MLRDGIKAKKKEEENLKEKESLQSSTTLKSAEGWV
jgi:hypothetical protein